jgi:hypothetical protein
MSVSLYPCLSYPACKEHIFCATYCLSYVDCMAVPHFSTFSQTARSSGKKAIEHNVCFDFLYNFVEKCLVLIRIWPHIINVHSLHLKYPLFYSDFNETWIFSKGFRKILKYQIS